MKKMMLLLILTLVALPIYAQEVIGPWTIAMVPSSATGTIVADSDWLNTDNTPVTLSEAFSGSSVIADGVANIGAGQYYQVTFPTPVVNGPGPELVVFEAQFDSGSYEIACNYDGFATTLSLPQGIFVNSGVSRSYYYGGGGPHIAQIWGATVDLSLLGVPDGASVTQVRVIAANNACDPLGVGALTAGSVASIPAISNTGLLLLGLMVGAAGLLFMRKFHSAA
jgi:hypothetical protein